MCDVAVVLWVVRRDGVICQCVQGKRAVCQDAGSLRMMGSIARGIVGRRLMVTREGVRRSVAMAIDGGSCDRWY